MPDRRKSHLIFQNFLGEAPDPPLALAPSALGFYWAPFPKFLDPPLISSYLLTGWMRLSLLSPPPNESFAVFNHSWLIAAVQTVAPITEEIVVVAAERRPPSRGYNDDR